MVDANELATLHATIAEQAATIARLEGELASTRSRADNLREFWKGQADMWRDEAVAAKASRDAACEERDEYARQANAAEAERDALTARVGRLQARVDALFSAASLGRAALGRHDRWCGHSRNAPGDAIIHQAERALTEALDPSRCLDCGTLDYIDGRAHYEDGIRCMACATVAALKEQP